MNRREMLAAPMAGALLPLASTSLAKGFAPEALGAKPMVHGIDRARARYILKEMGLDALLVCEPDNVRWSTGAVSALTRLGIPGAAAALVPADPTMPVTLICHQFAWYFSIADTGAAEGLDVHLVQDARDASGAILPLYLGAIGDLDQGERERHRRAATEATGPMHGSFEEALRAAVPSPWARERVIGYDGYDALRLVERALPQASCRAAREAALHMRLVKTEREIGAISQAAENNRLAAQAAVAELPQLSTSDELRRSFYAHAARLGNIPGFMVVNGSISENWVDPLREGTAILIDCVSSQNGYNGDYGRTVFIGEPPKAIARKAQAVVTAWHALRSELRPGLRFSEIKARGKAVMDSIDPGLPVPFNPHSVGLAHTEQPGLDFEGNPIDHVLEPGMIISVDCPLMQTGMEGTIHLEDLMLITPDGARAVHDTSDSILMV